MHTSTIYDYERFDELYKTYLEEGHRSKTGHPIFVFVANDDPKTNQSWCPDCVPVKPIIERMVQKFAGRDESVIMYVKVGSRDEWKTPDNPYRTHKLALTCVPTIYSLKNGLRLNGSECSDEVKVLELFKKSL